ncbi:MAG: amidohydrolase family protein [Acidimicrobiia bacterium]|nr:amidohydrolase family protein [Acidimicrobiia bacterium]
MICSFCGTRAEDAGNMVMGEAGAAICDACVDLAVDLVRERTTPIGDMVLDNIGALATNTPRFPGLLGLVTDAALAIRNGRVVWAGPAERTPQGLRSLARLDCGGRAVLPGLVDAHTHLAFAGDRSEEFVLRSTGMSGARAARSGGATTARLNHRADAAAIADIIGWRLNRMLDFGVTTVEASAGYSNDYERELALIGTVVEAGRHHVVDLVPTFDVLGLPVTASDRSRTLGEVAELHLPRAARLGAAVRLSLGTEALTTEEARRLIGVAACLGTRTRIHHRGQTPDAYKLALEASVPVVDHAGYPDRDQAEQMAEMGISVVITPTAALGARRSPASLRRLMERGVRLGLGTDCSPAPVMVESLPLAITLAVTEMGLTSDQAIWAATMGSAQALGMGDRGWLGSGAVADLVVLDAPSPTHLPYRPGTNLVWKVLKAGEVVVSK